MHEAAGNAWTLVLAGGDGTRLAQVTTRPDGVRVPKQYCDFFGTETLVQSTVHRAERVSAASQIMRVVSLPHQEWWEPQLRKDSPPGTVFVQQANQGTAAGILLPLLAIQSRDPQAVVTLLPSDHEVRDEPRLAAAIASALQAARTRRSDVILLGIEPETPDSGYGYIVPGDKSDGRTFDVASFVEKPSPEVAEKLIQGGALWSPFILCARVATLVELFAACTPDLFTAAFRTVTREQQGVEVHDNTALPNLDFSRDVLQRVPERLRVVRAPACGWSDLGTPDRLRECFERRAGRGATPGQGWIQA